MSTKRTARLEYMLRGYDFRDVERVEGQPSNTEVVLHFHDGTTAKLVSYPGEGLFQRCTAWLSAAREEA